MKQFYKILVLVQLLILSTFSFAGSTNQVAFGKDFVAYTSMYSYSTGNGRMLNIIPFRDDGKLTVTSNVKLQGRYHEMIIKDRFIFLMSNKKLYIFELDDMHQLSQLPTIDTPQANTIMIKGKYYSIFLEENKLLVLSDKNIEFIDLSKPKDLWKLELKHDAPRYDLSAYPRNHEGDWVHPYGSCVNSESLIYCLMYGKSTQGEEGGYLNFKDKYLVSKKRYLDVIDILRVEGIYETIH